MTYDGEFWQSRAPINSAQAIVRAHVPTLMVSGEGDYPAMGSLEWYVALQNASQGRSIWGTRSGGRRVIRALGPWCQGPAASGEGVGWPACQALAAWIR